MLTLYFVHSRKEKLLDSYDLQRFLSDYRDLMSWINSMMGLVSSDELASDVTGAEALLERHQVIPPPPPLYCCWKKNTIVHYNRISLTLQSLEESEHALLVLNYV